MRRSDKKRVVCEHCETFTGKPDTVRKHIASAHPEIVRQKKEEKVRKAKEKKKKQNQTAYSNKRLETSRDGLSTKSSNSNAKSAAKKPAAKERQRPAFVPFTACQQRDTICLPIFGNVDERTAFDAAHSE